MVDFDNYRGPVERRTPGIKAWVAGTAQQRNIVIWLPRISGG